VDWITKPVTAVELATPKLVVGIEIRLHWPAETEAGKVTALPTMVSLVP
jgi:hypothetical protein